MHGAIVTLDIETTGLDPKRDHIIEIGAVRSERGREEAAFQSFVNPGIPIPSFITNLTGIRDEDVAGAPAAAEALQEFAEFVGDCPVLAHNARFDLSFLQAGGILQENLVLDSVELAILLLPQAQRYSLSALAESLGIELKNAHRALEDARATSELYWMLWQKACALPADVKSEIVLNGEPFAWAPQSFFHAALTERRAPSQVEIASTTQVKPAVISGEDFSSHSMLTDTLTNCLRNRESMFLETGAIPHVGESSLKAAVHWAQEQGETVILVAQGEVQLEQLRFRAQQLSREYEFRWAELSAPQDHLCIQAWSAMRAFPPLDVDEHRFRTRVLIWLADGGQGERKELALRSSLEERLWRRICAEQYESEESAPCSWRTTQQETIGCQVILTTIARSHRLIREWQDEWATQGAVIVLDATQLEEKLSEWETSSVNLAEIESTLQTLLDARVGWLAELERRGAREDYLKILQTSIRAVRHQAREMFSLWEQLWAGKEGRWLNLRAEARSGTEFQAALSACRRFCDQGEEVVVALNRLIDGLAQKAGTASLILWMSALKDEHNRSLDVLRQVLLQDDARVLVWMGRKQRQERIQLQVAPLQPGRSMMQCFMDRGQTVILQDSAFDVGDDGRFWQRRLSQADLPLRSLPDPGRDATTDRVYIPQDVPTPNERAAFQRAMERSLIHIASAVEQRLIVLFTSYSQLRDTATAVRPRLALGGIPIFEKNLLSQYLAAERGLLLIHWRDFHRCHFPIGNFSLGILVRLPFDLPDQPLVASRAAEYEDGFHSFSVPTAITRMLRMLRKTQASARERSAWVILDSRIIKKRYGEMFVNALPEVEIHYGEIETVGPEIQQWLNRAAP